MSLVEDFSDILEAFFEMAVLVIVFTYAANQYLAALLASHLATSSSLAYIYSSAIFHNLYLFNDYAPLIFFGLNITALILAAYLRPSLMNIVVGFIFLYILPVISSIFSNVNRVVFSNPIIASTAAQFPQIIVIAAQYPNYTIAFTMLYMIIIAIRSRYFKGNSQAQQESPPVQVMNYGM